MCDKLSQCEQCDEVACLLFASTSPTKPANKLEFLCCKLRAISDAAGNASFELKMASHEALADLHRIQRSTAEVMILLTSSNC